MPQDRFGKGGVVAMTSAQRRTLILVAAIVGVAGIAYLALALTSGSTARPGTTVQGVDIGGMSQDEARAAVEDQLGPLAAKRLRVRALDRTFPVRPADAGLSLDAAASVQPAFGRTWNPLSLIANLTGTLELPAVTHVDEALLESQLQAVATQVDRPPTEPTVDVSGGTPVVTPGEPGRALDTSATGAALESALLKPRAPVEAVVVTVEPTVSETAVQEATAIADTATSAPVTVEAGSVSAVIPAEAIGRALGFTNEGGVLAPTLNGAVLHRAIAADLAPVEVDGRDATFKIRRGVPKVVKSKVGRGVSDADLASAVQSVLDKPAAERTVTVPIGTREPKLTTEEAEALGVTERMSTFTQNFPYAAYRVQNIGEAARRVNGTILMPGDTFSMNDTIKERTEENGYTKGFVVGEGGVFDEQLGGGVSTATTTVWTGAFFAGLERVQTVAHSIYISRYQPGLEATVAWGIFDMKFRNDTPNAVFITAGTTNTSMTVSFWGTKQYDEIKAESGERQSIVPFEKLYDTSKKCLGQDGVEGFTITVDRVFYKDGQEVKREPITTRYKPAPDVTCGPDPKDKKPGKKGDAATDTPSDPASPSAEPSDAPPDDVFSNG